MTYLDPPVISLENQRNLRLLHFSLGFSNLFVPRSKPDIVMVWFKSICQTIIVENLKIQILYFPTDPVICVEMEDVLLSMNERMQVFSVYLDEMCRDNAVLFPRLYREGIISNTWDTPT